MRHWPSIRQLQVLGLAVAVSAACGAPTGPSLPSEPQLPVGTVFTFRSGEDSQLVGGATVRLSGATLSGPFEATFTTDATGRITLDRPVLLSPVPELDVEAEGFLKRETLVRSSTDTRHSLWPSEGASGLDADFTAAIVYSVAGCPPFNSPVNYLQRQSSDIPEATFVLGPSLQDSAIIEKHEQAIAALNSVLPTGRRFSLALAEPSSGVIIRASLEPGHSLCLTGRYSGFTSYDSTAGGVISGAQVRYCSQSYAENVRVITHEIGHTLGLGHSFSTDDVMGCSSSSTPPTFSSREQVVLDLMYQRLPRNRWPDNDRSVAGMAPLGLASEVLFVCPGRF